MLALRQAADAPAARLVSLTVLDRAFPAAMAWKAAFDGDHLSALVWSVIDLANTEHLFGRPDQDEIFRDGEVSDARRKPIAVRALGARLDLDDETVRRVAKRLVRQGLCELLSGGVIVRSAAYRRPEIEAASQQTLLMLGETEGRQPLVLFLMEFLVRYTTENMRVFDNNIVRADSFLCVLAENARPISVRGIARRIGHSVETTRRHANRLLADGFLIRSGDGLVVAPQAVVRPDFAQAAQAIDAGLVLLARRLARLAGGGGGVRVGVSF